MNLCEMQDLLQNNFVGLAIPKCSILYFILYSWAGMLLFFCNIDKTTCIIK